MYVKVLAVDLGVYCQVPKIDGSGGGLVEYGRGMGGFWWGLGCLPGVFQVVCLVLFVAFSGDYMVDNQVFT